jgi:hypothetical protein
MTATVTTSTGLMLGRPTSCRGQLKRDGTRAETRFRLSAKRTSPFKSAGASVQSTRGSRGVRISGSNAGYTMFRGSMKSNDYPLHSPVSPSLPLPASQCAITFQLESTQLYCGVNDKPAEGFVTDTTSRTGAHFFVNNALNANKRRVTSLHASSDGGLWQTRLLVWILTMIVYGKHDCHCGS